MRFGHRIRTALLVIALVIVVPGLGLRIYMGSGAEDRLAPEEAVNIADLRSPLPRTSFLAYPADYCAVASTVVSPIFDMP